VHARSLGNRFVKAFMVMPCNNAELGISACAARKRAQRARPLNQSCQLCGKSECVIDAHHPDIQREPFRVIYVCRQCHIRLDVMNGTRKRNQDKLCLQCGKATKERRTRNRFCSRACQMKHKASISANMEGETRTTCLVCRRKNPGRIRLGRRFCTRRCATINRNRQQA
jgi:hypothetical protein